MQQLLEEQGVFVVTDLPEDLRTVDVFLYLMTFTDKQLTDDRSVELRLKDKVAN